jgi:hypothetical protein
MSFPAGEPNPLARTVEVTDAELIVALADGRKLSVPLVWFPRLLHATAEQRQRWELLGDGEGMHWPLLDEDISVQQLLACEPPAASSTARQRTFLSPRQRCPECEYRLEAPPPSHQCPKCGFVLDTTAIVFHGRRPAWTWVIFVTLLTLAQVAGLIRAVARADVVEVVLGVIVVALLAAYSTSLIRRLRPHSVTVTDGDVIYRDGGRERWRVSLASVWSAEYLSLSNEIVLLGPDGELVATVPNLADWDYSLVAGLCSAVSERAAAPPANILDTEGASPDLHQAC